MATGGCLCGAVRYAVTGELRPVVYCHCDQCRRTTGHFMAATAAPIERFSLTEDRSLRWYASSNMAKRGFCGDCGATLFWRRNDAPRISIAAGTLDSGHGVSADRHIYADTQGEYYELTDGLPVYPESD
ncbi:MAG: GFA family protein [Pseudomonadota bacterium]